MVQTGNAEAVRFGVARCSLGALVVAGNSRGICSIALGSDADTLIRELRERYPAACRVDDDANVEAWGAAIARSIEDPSVALRLPLDVRGTSFQRLVWETLRRIPVGSTVTYTDLARTIGKPDAVRAVAHACASNTLAVAIPCHRVVRRDGGLAGYRWGMDRKQTLLERESRARPR